MERDTAGVADGVAAKTSLFDAGLNPSIESRQRVGGMPSFVVDVGWTPRCVDWPGPSHSTSFDTPWGPLDGQAPSSSSSYARAPSTVGPDLIFTTGGSMLPQRVPPPKITNEDAAPNASYLTKHEGSGECEYTLRSTAADVKGKGKACAL